MGWTDSLAQWLIGLSGNWLVGVLVILAGVLKIGIEIGNYLVRKGWF